MLDQATKSDSEGYSHYTDNKKYKCGGDDCTICWIENHLRRFWDDKVGKVLTFVESFSTQDNVEARKDIIRNLLHQNGFESFNYTQSEIIERVAAELNLEGKEI